VSTLAFRAGTLEARDVDESLLPADFVWDAREACFRAPASAYAETVKALHKKVDYEDRARGYRELPHGLRAHREARPFQTRALDAWLRAGGRGVVVLPTGAGKSWLAAMAIDKKRRDTLVIAPTLDLVRQWYDLLRSSFGQPVGVVGGGEHDVKPLTVSTYDSAYMHMEHLGNRFGMVVFDECHHLPSESYALAARFCLAPFRLGLSATPERVDGRHALLDALVGPELYREDITTLAGQYLAEYDVERVEVDLTGEERAAYELNREVYREFLRASGIRMSDPDGWSQFIVRSAQSADGRAAMSAWRKQRQIAFAAESKLEYIDALLHEHRRDRTILFTHENAIAYTISRRFLVPVITHRTKVRERSEILDGFRAGTYRAIATSRVLNEGVDVPAANVAVVVSGSGSVREHVQRLGRVLRKDGDKRAILYELVSAGTAEAWTSERRREHAAYREEGPMFPGWRG
jgi:superfamily II DNA or RNA helicase